MKTYKMQGLMVLLVLGITLVLAVPALAAGKDLTVEITPNSQIGGDGKDAISLSNEFGRLVIRSYENPLTVDDMNTIRNEEIARAKVILSKTGKPMVDGVPVCKDEDRIVAYGYIVDNSGIPHQYIGVSGNNDGRSMSLARTTAQEWFDKATKDAAIGVSMEYEARGADFPCIWQHTYNNTTYPYGQTTNNAWLYKLSNDGSSTYDFYGWKQFFVMAPGCSIWYNTWQNYEGLPSQDWGWGDIDYGLQQWGPTGNHSGAESYGISLTAGTGGIQGTLSWTYSQNDESRYDYSLTSPWNKASWTYIMNSSAAKTHTEAFTTGSTCETYQKPAGSGVYHLVRVKALGAYRNTNGGQVVEVSGTQIDMSIQY